MKKNKDQVQLSKLVFTQSWEDPECDHKALKIKKDEVLVAITSGACNVLGFLQFDPAKIYAIDINAAQSFLLALKMAAIKSLEYEDFIGFSGLTDCHNRLELFEKIKPQLSEESLSFWESKKGLLENGFIMNGKYDRFVKFAGRFLKLIQGQARIDGLFKPKDIKEQKAFYDEVWDTRQYKAIYKILFNKHILARKGLSSDYFHFDDGSSSFAESFYKRARNAFRNLPIKGNYFLSLYVKGRYANTDEVPDYLKREHYKVIKSRIDRIEVVTSDAQGWIDTIDDASIDCFALSNICELMSEDETNRLFNAVYRTAKPDARVIFRNLMIPREVPNNLEDRIVKNKNLSTYLQENDRSFVYGKVAAYSIEK